MRAGQGAGRGAPNGRLLGTFMPRLPEADISEEGAQRIENDTTGMWYTAEVEAKLRELRSSRDRTALPSPSPAIA